MGELLSTMSSADPSFDMQVGQTPVNRPRPEEDGVQSAEHEMPRKKVVVVGLGMVGVAFM